MLMVSTHPGGFYLPEKVLDDFSNQVDRINGPVGCPATIHDTALDGWLSTHQNPREADPSSKVQLNSMRPRSFGTTPC